MPLAFFGVAFAFFVYLVLWADSPRVKPKNAPQREQILLFAERAGFEPAIAFPLYTLSRRAPSTTRTPLLPLLRTAKIRFQDLAFEYF